MDRADGHNKLWSFAKKWITKKGLWLFLLYFAVCFFSAYPDLGKNGLDNDLNFSTTAQQIIKKYNGSDIASYATASLDIAHHGWYQPPQQWVLYLWPPGVPVVEGVLHSLFGVDHPIILSLALFSCGLWALVMLVLYGNLNFIKYSFFRAGLPLVLLLIPEVRVFALREGVGMSGGLAAGFQALAIGLCFFGIIQKNLKWSLLSGFFLAAAGLTRINFDLNNQVLLGLVLLVFVAALLRSYFKTKKISFRKNLGKYKFLLLPVMAYFFIMLPYKSYMMNRTGHFNVAHPVTYYWMQFWMTDEHLVERGAGHVSQGLGGMACRVRPKLCKEYMDKEFSSGRNFRDEYKTNLFYKNEAMKALKGHFFQWMSIKLQGFTGYWNATPPALIDPIKTKVFLNLSLLGLLLLMLVAGLWWGIKELIGRGRLYNSALAIFMGGAAAGGIGPYLIMHYEVRYFYPIKMTILFFLILFVGSFLKNSENLKI